MPYELLLVRNVRRQPPDDKPIATEEADKKARADYTIENRGSLDELDQSVRALREQLLTS